MNKIFGISVTLQRNKPFTFQLTWAESLREFFVPAVRQPVSSSAYTSICYFRLHQNQRDKKFKQYQIKTKSLYWILNLPIRLQWPWDKPKIDNIIVEWITEVNINIHVLSKRVSKNQKLKTKTNSKKINKKYDWFKKNKWTQDTFFVIQACFHREKIKTK